MLPSKFYEIIFTCYPPAPRGASKNVSQYFFSHFGLKGGHWPHKKYENIAFVLLLLLYFIYFSPSYTSLVFFQSPKRGNMCNKNKVHMVLTRERYQLNFQRLFAWIILLFIVLPPSVVLLLLLAFHLIEAHTFHIAIQVCKNFCGTTVRLEICNGRSISVDEFRANWEHERRFYRLFTFKH